MTDISVASLASIPHKRRMRIHSIDAAGVQGSLPAAELEQRLLEIGFVEGATVEVRHQGLGRDPLAVRVNEATVALRRREAHAIKVTSI